MKLIWRYEWLVVLVIVTGVFLIQDLGAARLNLLLLYLPGIDKVLHTVQSMIIAVGFYWLLGRITPRFDRRMVLAGLATLVIAVADEAQQQWVAGRSVDAKDVVAAGGGVVLGLAAVAWIAQPRLRRTAGAAFAAAAILVAAVGADSFYRTRDYNRGLLFERDGRFKEARVHFHRALDAGLESASLFNFLAWVEIESGEGNAAAAVAWAERALQLKPADPDTLDTYGWALHHAGRTAEALAPLQQALERKPGIFCVHYHLGVVLLDLGRHQEAIQHLRLQVQLKPRTREAVAAAGLLQSLGPTGTGAA